MGLRRALGEAWVKHRRKVERVLVGPGHVFVGWHRGRPAGVRASLYCVYREKNAGLLGELLASLPATTAAHLHALDAVAPALADRTRSSGPGQRMELLQELIDANPPRPGDYVVIADDDVTFLGSGGRSCIGLASAAGLDVAQPAHAFGSHHTWITTRVEALSVVRRTTYVEVGPFVVLSPRAQAWVLPFPPESGMGWGVDIAWSGMAGPEFLLGVVDATPVVHHGEVGVAYSAADADVYLQSQLAALGVSHTSEVARNVGLTWRPWQKAAKWVR